MARYIGPKCRLCRREGVPLFLKGTRCEGTKCALLRRQQSPGQHANSHRQLSPYGRQLREKQKAKRIYGVMEAQFRKYYREAEKHALMSGEKLLQILETRLDNVLFRLGVAHSRAHSRKMIQQKKILLNGKLVTTPSIRLSVGDVLSFADEKITLVREDREPTWLVYDKKNKQAKVNRLPEREDITEPVEEQLIVEYYSR